MTQSIIILSLMGVSTLALLWWCLAPFLGVYSVSKKRRLWIGFFIALWVIAVGLYIRLGHPYLLLALETENTQQIASAELAQLEELVKADPDNETLMLRYLSAKAFTTEGKLVPEDVERLEKILEKDPYSLLANQMLATNDYLNQHYEAAILRWEKMRDNLAANKGNQKAIDLFNEAIQKAKRKQAEQSQN